MNCIYKIKFWNLSGVPAKQYFTERCVVGLRCLSTVVSHAGAFLVKSVLRKCNCEFTAVSCCLGFVVCGVLFFLSFLIKI